MPKPNRPLCAVRRATSPLEIQDTPEKASGITIAVSNEFRWEIASLKSL